MKLSIKDLYEMNPKNFLNAQLGFSRVHEQIEQGEWERARWLACVIINPHLKKSISPGKITTFPWEIKNRNKSKIDIDKLIKESALDDKIQETLKIDKNA